MRARTTVGIALCVVLSGCLGGGQTNDIQQDPSSGDGDVDFRSTLELEDCSFWWGIIDIPPALNPGRPPPGFDAPGREALAITIIVLRFDCEHILFGNLDRGPVSLLLEMHNNVVPREECRSFANGTGYWVAHTFLTPDEGVLNASLAAGLPAHRADMGPFPDLSGGLEAMTDQWNAEGYPASEVRVERDEFSNRFSPVPHRIFWSDGETLWVGDMMWEGAGSAVSRRAMVGSFAEPMLLSKVADPMTLGSFWFTDATASISIQEFPSGTCDG